MTSTPSIRHLLNLVEHAQSLTEARVVHDYRHAEDRTIRHWGAEPYDYISPDQGFFFQSRAGELVLHSERNFVYSAAVSRGSDHSAPMHVWNHLGGKVDLAGRTVTISKENYGQGMKMRQRAIANLKELQQVLRSLRPYGVTDNFAIKGVPTHVPKTVGALMQASDPTDEILKGNAPIMYHGTSTSRWASIQKVGLQPGHTPDTYPDLRGGYSEHNIYLATTAKGAEFYAKRQAKKDGDTGWVILAVRLPDPARLKADDRVIHGFDLSTKIGNDFRRHTPDELRRQGDERKRLARSGREMGEFAYRGKILPTNLRVIKTGKA